MDNNYLQKLKETFKDLTNIKPEQMQSLMRDTLQVIRELQEMMKSGNPETQEKAIAFAAQIKTILEEQASALSQLAGRPLADLVASLEKHPPQTETGKVLKEEFQNFKNELTGLTKSSEGEKAPEIKPGKKTHKLRSNWILS